MFFTMIIAYCYIEQSFGCCDTQIFIIITNKGILILILMFTSTHNTVILLRDLGFVVTIVV